MADDVLILGGIAFTGYAPPEKMMGGGKQAMKVQKLPGGSRVIDTLGPDEDEIQWNGEFYDSGAYDMALQLDSMRAAGQVIALEWGGQYRQVIIQSFTYHVRRLPVWVEYDISCTVVSNPALGVLGGSSISTGTSLVGSDLSSAAAVQ